jgi:hypothetical protein
MRPVALVIFVKLFLEMSNGAKVLPADVVEACGEEALIFVSVV